MLIGIDASDSLSDSKRPKLASLSEELFIFATCELLKAESKDPGADEIGLLAKSTVFVGRLEG